MIHTENLTMYVIVASTGICEHLFSHGDQTTRESRRESRKGRKNARSWRVFESICLLRVAYANENTARSVENGSLGARKSERIPLHKSKVEQRASAGYAWMYCARIIGEKNFSICSCSPHFSLSLSVSLGCPCHLKTSGRGSRNRA